MIALAIQSLLTFDGTITSGSLALTAQVEAAQAILQPLLGTRVHNIQLPKNATNYMATGMPPSVFHYRASIDPTRSHDGPCDLTKAIVRIHVIAGDPETVRTCHVAIRNLLDGWRGSAGATPGPIVVQMLFVTDGADAFDPPLAAAELGLSESMIEIEAHYNNP